MIHVLLAQFSGQIKQNLCGSTTGAKYKHSARNICSLKTATHVPTIDALNTELGLMILN